MSILDIKQMRVNFQQQPVRAYNNLAAAFNDITPRPSTGFTYITFPDGKIDPKAFTGFKFLNGVLPVLGSFVTVDSEQNSIFSLRVNVAGLTLPYTQVDILFPFESSPLALFADNAAFAAGIAALFNAFIAVMPVEEAAFGGANPIAMSWVPLDAAVGGVGFFIIRNVYNVPMSLICDPVDIQLPLGPILGFGYSNTEYAIRLISRTTTSDFRLAAGTTCAYIFVVTDFVSQGAYSGIAKLDGTENTNNVITAIPRVDVAATAPNFNYTEKINVPYVFIDNSIMYKRLKERIFNELQSINGGTDLQMVQQEITNDYVITPFMRLRLTSSDGHPVRSDAVFGAVNTSKIEFIVIFNETTGQITRIK